MLYGNLIFIKKTGGDGSKYPVTEKDIKIGRSDNCLIRIYNPQVALEHCQLIIEDSGQATLRNLSKQTILNGKPLTHEDVTLGHGDIFKVGERLARWEYLPTSKFYKQLLSPTGRLVAVVMPQQRSLGSEATPGTSATQVSVAKTTSLGKRKSSERATSENSSAVKIRKSNGSELIHRGRGDLKKLLTGRHSFKTTKLLLKGAKIKERKSISGIISSKSSKGKVLSKCRKSTLPSWKVNFVSSPGRKSSEKKSLAKSSEKSGKSPKSAVPTLLKDITESNPEKLLCLGSKTGIKTPHKIVQESKSSELVKSSSITLLKTPLKTRIESPIALSEGSARLTRFSMSRSPPSKKPSLKSPSNAVLSTPKQNSKFSRLVNSESKLKSTSVKPSVYCKAGKRMSLILEKVDSIPRQNIIKEFKESVPQEKTKTPKIRLSGVISESIVQIPLKIKSVTAVKEKRSSLKNTSAKKNPNELKKTPRKRSVNKTQKSSTENKRKSSRKSIILNESLTPKQSKTPRSRSFKKLDSDSIPQSSPLIDLDYEPGSKKQQFPSRKSAPDKSHTPKRTPAKSCEDFGNVFTQFLDNRKNHIGQNETLSSTSPSFNDKHLNSSAIFSAHTSTLPVKRVTSKKLTCSSKSIASQRGTRRKLSPSSSAERAAKKLKISCPKKPDKNKKAALLVLGKANRKQLASQNLKVLLKQKILKKAIKQSSAMSARGDKSRTKTEVKLKKRALQPELNKKDKPNVRSSMSKDSTASDELIVKLSNEDKTPEVTAKNKKAPEMISSLSSKGKIVEVAGKSDSRQNKISDFPPYTISSDSFTQETSSSSSIFEKSAENYFFNSNRRCSKRLSSKNDTGRPDFIELSPTALGLIPKNIELFKTPRANKRRSSSLVTPKNLQTLGIIKSASTSKIGNRKSVRFSSKDISISSGFCSPSITEKTDFDFSALQTPNITVDVFISPLTDQIPSLKKDLSDTKVTFLRNEISSCSSTLNRTNNTVPKTCVRKLLQSPQSKTKLNEILSSELPGSSSTIRSSSLSLGKVEKQSRASLESKSPKNYTSDSVGIRQVYKTREIQNQKESLSDLSGVSRLLGTPKDVISSKNDLVEVNGAKKMLRTPKAHKSPKNDLSNVSGVKQLLRTPKVQKSPRNDLTDIGGVKKLMRTPKVQKSPKNDLTDIRGVKKLMRTHKVQKSPKNDLTDIRGVKKLMRTPKVQKSPKNDLTDIRGVKKLMRTPKVQKSPKNDLTDIRGVKKLMRTPKVQKSPKNDLTDIRGVKKLMRTPKVQKSPKNDLTDIRGVKKLMRTPKVQKSPKNDLSDVIGVKQLFKSPRVQKNPKNDLSDLRGVKKLLGSPKLQKSPKNDLTDVGGVKKLFTTPCSQKSPKNSLLEVSGLKTLFESPISLISKNLESNLGSKVASKKMHVKDFRAIRGRRTIYANSKSPKNDLSDVTGVRELFSRHKAISNYNINLVGVSELFDLPTAEDLEQKITIRPKKVLKTGTVTRSRKTRATNVDTQKKRTRNKKSEAAASLVEKKPVKRKAVEKVKTSLPKKGFCVVKSSKKSAVDEKLQASMKVEPPEEHKSEIRSSRKRKVLVEDLEKSPPRLRRRMWVDESSSKESATSKRAVSRSKAEKTTKKRSPAKSIKKVSEKAKSNKTSTATSKVQTKSTIKTGTKENQKVQSKRSQTRSKKNVSSSAETLSPRKTRSTKARTEAQKISKVQLKGSGGNVKSVVGRKKLSPVVKRSTRRK